MSTSDKKLISEGKNIKLNAEIDKLPMPEDVIIYNKNVILQEDHFGWFVKPENKKEKKVDIYCAACQNIFNDYKPKHNTYINCPHCKNEIHVRRALASKDYSINNTDNICYIQKFDNVIIARFFDLGRYYTDEPLRYKKSVKQNIWEYQRIFFRDDSVKSYLKFNSYFSKESNWDRMAKVNEHIGNYHIINNNFLQELFEGTHLSGTAWFTYKLQNSYLPIHSLYKFVTWPVLEYLLKLGYTKLVDEIVQGRSRGDKILNLYMKKANAVLGVPHSILQKYDHPNLRECDIKAIKQLMDYGRLGQLTPERFEFISSILTSDSNDPLDIFRNFGIEKVLNYMNKVVSSAEKINEEAHCAYGYKAITMCSAWRDFQDYRKECHELGYDLTDEGILFPKDFYTAHKKTSEIIEQQREELERCEKSQRNAKLAEKFHEAIKKFEDKVLNNENLLFTVCHTPEELQNEGNKLKHCVYNSYLTRVIEKTSLIFFIREQKDPEKPFYTLEVNPKTFEIVQCRGFSNINAPKEVYNFAEKCAKEIKVSKVAA